MCSPKAGKPVSFAALKSALKKAGYTLDSADITVTGTFVRDDKGSWIVTSRSAQRFALNGKDLEQVLSGVGPETPLEIIGRLEDCGGREFRTRGRDPARSKEDCEHAEG